MKISCWIIASLFGLSLAALAPAAEYFVDFDGGKDANNGDGPAAAFKHCPGDPDATANAKTLKLQPGDIIRFKGGVHYRGAITVTASGSQDKPIIFDGNTDGKFGDGRAVITGADPLTGWEQCTSVEQAGGNRHFKDLYWTQGPKNAATFSWNLAENGKLLFCAEGPNAKSPFIWSREHYLAIPAKNATKTSVRDPNLAVLGGEDLAGAFIQVYCRTNWIRLCRITGFNAQTDTLSFEKNPRMGGYYDEFRYSLLNHPRLIDKRGEFAVDQKTGRVFLMPRNRKKPSDDAITISRRKIGFLLQNVSDVTIRGFRIQQFAAGLEENGGNALKAVNGKRLHIINNQMTMNRSMKKQGVLCMTKVTDSLIEKNALIENPFYRVMLLDGFNDSIVRGNTLDTNSGTGIVCFRTHRTTIVGNTIKKHIAMHSQGMAIYAKCDGVTIEKNIGIDGTAVTVQDSLNVTIRKNRFNAEGRGFAIGLWGGGTATVKITGNLLTGSSNQGWSKGVSLFSNNGDAKSTFLIEKNYLDGIGGSIRGDVKDNTFLKPETFEKYKGNGNTLNTRLNPKDIPDPLK